MRAEPGLAPYDVYVACFLTSACGCTVSLTCIHQHSLSSQLEFLVGVPAECMFDSSCIGALRLFAGGVVMLLSAFLCTGYGAL